MPTRRQHLALALLGLLTLAGGCGPRELKPFPSAEGRFSVRLPGGHPREHTQKAAGLALHTFTVEERHGTYMVAYSDLGVPAEEPGEAVQARLASARDGAVLNVGGAMKSTSPLAPLLGKHPGCELTADLPNQKGVVRARIYLAGARLYQLQVLGSKEFVTSDEAASFFASFTVQP